MYVYVYVYEYVCLWGEVALYEVTTHMPGKKYEVRGPIRRWAW